MTEKLTTKDVQEILTILNLFKGDRCCDEHEDKEVDELAKRFDDTINHMKELEAVAEAAKELKDNMDMKDARWYKLDEALKEAGYFK